MASLKYFFSPGDRVYTTEGEVYTILAPLGRGGQGEAYKVRGAEGTLALKWYYADRYLAKIDAERFYQNLERNVENGVPKLLSSGTSATQFIWPQKLMYKQSGSFGYLMNLFPNGYEPLEKVILGRKKDPVTGKMIPLRWSSWYARVTAALNIVSAFEILHASGLSYQDVNEGGFSVNMKDGNVFICDCDNVAPDQTNLGIKGVYLFMAPEVLRGEKKPDRSTDEYSLAVLLFRLFLHGHPMHGKKSHYIRKSEMYTDQEANMLIYGTDPCYCLASYKNQNPPDPVLDKDVLTMSLAYPKILLDSFEQVFTEGVKNPSKRLTATQWRKLLLNVRDHLIQWEGREYFAGRILKTVLPRQCRSLCYSNGKESYEVLCVPGKYLFPYHFDTYSREFKKPAGRIIETNKPGVIGFINNSGKAVTFFWDGKTGECPNGGKLPLLPGMRLKAGRTEILVK